jgi:hypothetical protein
MVIETQLTRNQFILLSFWQHISRKTFYFYAATCLVITIWIMLKGDLHLFLVGWIPLVIYLFFGVITTLRESSVKEHPAYLPTRYEFTPRGVTIKNERSESTLEWNNFDEWRVMVGCYVLMLSGGRMLAIPLSTISRDDARTLEKMLRQHIDT